MVFYVFLQRIASIRGSNSQLPWRKGVVQAAPFAVDVSSGGDAPEGGSHTKGAQVVVCFDLIGKGRC